MFKYLPPNQAIQHRNDICKICLGTISRYRQKNVNQLGKLDNLIYKILHVLFLSDRHNYAYIFLVWNSENF